MTTTWTYGDLLAALFRRDPDLGFIATADSVAAGSITDASALQNSRFGPDEVADLYQYRYNRTGEDRWKPGGTINSSGVWVNDGTSYSNTSDLQYACVGAQPDRILGWFTEAQRRQQVPSHRALVMGHDLDMETSGVQYWDGTLGGSSATNVAVTKTATAGNVFSGTQALFLNYSGANGVCLSEAIRVNPSKQIYTAILARADIGTLTFRLYDIDNAGYFGTDISTTSEEWVLIWRIDTVPPGCEQIRYAFKGTGASDDIYVDTCFGPYEAGKTVYNLPDGIDKAYKLKMVRPSRYTENIASGVEAASSRVWVKDLVQNTRLQSGDYTVETFPREVVPNKITFLDHVDPSLLQTPLWLAVDRPLSDFEPITSEAGTTTADLDEVIDYVQLVAYEDLSNADIKDPAWGDKYAKAIQLTAVVPMANPPPARQQTPTRHRVGWHGGGSGGWGIW